MFKLKKSKICLNRVVSVIKFSFWIREFGKGVLFIFINVFVFVISGFN